MHDPLSAWWSTISLRTKITGVTVLLVTLGLLVAGVGTMTVLRNYLVSDVDTRIKGFVSDLTAEGLLDSACTIEGPANDYYVGVVNSAGRVICNNAQEKPPRIEVMTSDQMSSSEDALPFTLWDGERSTQWRLVAVPDLNTRTGEPVALVVGQNLDQTNDIITNYALTFLGFGVSVLVLGAALTRLLVTSTFAPLRQVEATAAAIANGNFSERLPGATPNTEVGRLNRSLNTMLARIDRAFGDRANTIEQMRRFVGDASHELRTPLVSVRGYAELYRMGALTTPEEIAQAMERIEKEAIRMGGLVEDLLELARIDEAKPLQRAPVDLVPIAYDAASDAMASAPDRQVDVVFNDPEPEAEYEEPEPAEEPERASGRGTATVTRSRTFAGTGLGRLRSRRGRSSALPETVDSPTERRTLDTPAIVLADENKIRQVVTNLLGNALRFTNAGSPIEIGVGVDHARHVATIDIIDHGDGIPPQIREKIFQRFWRADTSRTRETGGSGLGLAIVAGIVIAHDGSVEVLETEGGGATFRVILPLLPEDWTPPQSPVDAAPTPQLPAPE